MKIIGMKKIIMKTTFISRTPITALLILLGISATPAYAAVAGRVLVSVGDSVAIRNGQEVRLRFGSQIEDKDTLRTGAAGTLQVRFTDQSIVALREKSTFKLEQYAYAKENGGAQTGVFNLIKGGFRTITGLIGKSNQKSYSVKTAAATIGIRGTHYAVRVCENDCKNPDGSNAKDGVYGSVLSASDKDSRIVINNLSGENEFGRDEHFYVKDEKSSPEMLLVPPSFVADNLKGRGQVANGKSGKDDEGRNDKAGREAGEVTGRNKAEGSSDDDPRPNMISRTFESKVTVTDPNCTTGDCRNLPPPPLQRGSVEVTGKVGHIAGLTTGGSISGLISKNDELTLKPTGELIRVEQGILGEVVTQQRILDIGLASNIGAGRNAAAGNLAWGAWIGNGITDQSASITRNPLNSFVYLYGDAAGVLPNLITATYRPIGGIAIDRSGNIGKITGGDISVDFLKQLVSLNNLSVGMGNRSFTYNTVTQATIAAGGAFSDSSGIATCTGTGTCATSYLFNSSGMFTGASAQGIGLHYSLDGGAADQIIGVEGFLREVTTLQILRPVINASNFGVAGGLATTIVSGLGATEKLLSFTASPTLNFAIANGVETDLSAIIPLPAVTDMVDGIPAINAHWGRWVNGALNIDGFLTMSTGVHYIYGFDLTTPSLVATRNGIFNFTHLAGTTPTDDAGNIASIASFGSMFVNFQTRDGVMSPMSWTINAATHNINSVDITLTPDAQLGVVIINGNSIDGTCTGAACVDGGVASTQVTGAFAGANGNYAALSIATQSPAGNTASAQIYSCANCGSTVGITPAGAVVAYAGGTGLTTFANTDNPLFILPTDKTLDGGGTLIAYNTLFGDSASLGGGAIFDQGAAAGGPAGDGYGRWNGGSITGTRTNQFNPNLPATPFTPASGIHVLYSAALTLPEVIAARTGNINFNHAGGTLPTDHLGNTGTFGGGNLSVDFNQNTAAMNANWNVGGVDGVNYTLNATPLTLLVDGGGAHIGAFLSNDITATCTACSPNINQVATIDQLNIQGNFSGAAGNTINMAISTFDAGVGANAPTPVTSASVQVFQEGALPVLALQRGALP